MDVTLGKVLPPGFADQASRLAEQLRSAAPGVAPQIEDPTLGTLSTAGSQLGAQVGGKGVFESFSTLLNQALQDVNQLHQTADADAQKLVAGEPVDIHQVMIGMEKANVAFGLTLQVRNKLVEAYQEIMRMQV